MRNIYRSLLLSLGSILVILSVPVIWLIRKIFFTSLWFGIVSVWTGSPIITIAKNCRAERMLGFNSVSVVRESYYITDEFDWVLSNYSLNKRILTTIFSHIAVLLICLFAKQVHAYVDGGILPLYKRREFNPIELWLYRIFQIKLFIWTYGGDVRTKKITLNMGEPNCCTNCTQVNSACICDFELFKKNYSRVVSSSRAIFSMGDMIEYTVGSKNNTFFWPIDLTMHNGKRYSPHYPIMNNHAVRIVHAPNHRELKGTMYLEKSIQILRNEGLLVELIMVEKISNEQALDIYRTADIIFDQCLIGFHGYFALEAMALGKPVMCFIRSPEKYLLHPGKCPIINTHIDTLTDDLRQLIKQRHILNDIGKNGRSYIEQYYSIPAFSERLKIAYQELGTNL